LFTGADAWVRKVLNPKEQEKLWFPQLSGSPLLKPAYNRVVFPTSEAVASEVALKDIIRKKQKGEKIERPKAASSRQDRQSHGCLTIERGGWRRTQESGGPSSSRAKTSISFSLSAQKGELIVA